MTGMSAEPGQSGGSPQAIADAVVAGIDGSVRVGLVTGSDAQALEDVRRRVQFDLLAQGREAVRISGRNLADLNGIAARLAVAGCKDAGEALRVYARAGLDVALLIDGAEDLSGAVVPPLNALLKSSDIGPRLLVLLFGSDAAGPIASLLADGLGQGAVIRTTISPPHPIAAPAAPAPGVTPDGAAEFAAGAEFTEELIEAAHDAGPDVAAPAQVPEDQELPVSEAAYPAPDTATAPREPEVAPPAAPMPPADAAAEPPVHAEDQEPGRPVIWQPEWPAANVNVPLTPEPVAADAFPPREHDQPLELGHHAVSSAVVGGAIPTAPQVVPSGRWAEIGSAPATVAPRRRRRRGRVLVSFLVIVAFAAGGAWAVVHYRAELPPAVRERVDRVVAAVRPVVPARLMQLIQGGATQTGTGPTAAPEAAAPTAPAQGAATDQPPVAPSATAPEPSAAGGAAQPTGSPPPSPVPPTASAPPQTGAAPASAGPTAAEAPPAAASPAPPATASAPATTERDAAGAPVRLRPGFTTNPSEQTPATERVAPGAVAPAPPAPPPVSSHEPAASAPAAPTPAAPSVPAAPAAGSSGTPAPVTGPGSRSDAVPTQPEQQQAAATPVAEEPKPGAAETPDAAASMPAGAG